MRLEKGESDEDTYVPDYWPISGEISNEISTLYVGGSRCSAKIQQRHLCAYLKNNFCLGVRPRLVKLFSQLPPDHFGLIKGPSHQIKFT